MSYLHDQNTQYKYFTLMAMISVTMMVISMLGPFMAPGGVFVFALTYTIADVITEVYGFRMIKQIIFSTLL